MLCRESRSLALAGIHTPFLPAVKLWLQVLRDQAKWRLQGAVDVDTVSVCPDARGRLILDPCNTITLCLCSWSLWTRLPNTAALQPPPVSALVTSRSSGSAWLGPTRPRPRG